MIVREEAERKHGKRWQRLGKAVGFHAWRRCIADEMTRLLHLGNLRRH
jgi:hypothetical protein